MRNRVVEKLIEISCDKGISNRNMVTVGYLNLFVLNHLWKRKSLRKTFNSFDYIYNDGWGSVWWFRRFGVRMSGRNTAMDFIDYFFEKCVENKRSVYLLGSRANVLKTCVENIKSKYPNLKIVGFNDGYFLDSNRIVKSINKARPDLLLVGLSTPKQEEWMIRNKRKLKVKVGWTVGSLFEYLAGEKPHCPYLLGLLHLEWLFRLFVEPRRLWQRYLFMYPYFGMVSILGIISPKKIGLDRILRKMI